MKIYRFRFENKVYAGALSGESYAPLELPRSTYESILIANPLPDNVLCSETSPLAPVKPSKIVCVGRNYAAHAEELGNSVPTEPMLFLKAPSSIIGDGDAIQIPTVSKRVEHEAELGIVIGRQCKQILQIEDPFDYIYGYTCVNDVTARDVQRNDIQFTRAKSFDTFCPIGPCIETVFSPIDKRVRSRVNGNLKQDGNTDDMIFDIPFLLRYISMQMTLYPGDLIATGTPSGVSSLAKGDICEIEIEGIGNLRNPLEDI